ncbi:FCD domain-containing protein [Brevibacterium sp. 50QC2O2]|jgi:DNA-binding FadR family transcriptional regulator|uniref:FadR/GntR family transcriptional regulator n=1 Tax=Brevibacterium TaxID=1696 RepID=UPI00211BAC55|nr:MULTISPECIES: FCD domain-containing protein [unclassified Brevibacterium]MCQ9367903.1 FCD domain-containing protein [Brevibacterium sp. 91QC2O2]MCQ9386355.1 FCD domain-containing protein [Brevibacterium sp. 68QC2CO]MCQ9387133.1 FCD domain-containing protein [Brevibacterium sp. 50QC2O2]
MALTGRDLHTSVVEQWGQEIVSGERPVGAIVSTDAVAAQFGVSRGVIREVVRVLESMGLVASRQRVGITVQPQESWSPYNPDVLRWRLAGPQRAQLLGTLAELRAAVEPSAARRAAERASGEQCAALAAAYVGMVATARDARTEDYLRHDMDFHRVLLQASGNEFFAGLTGVVDALLAGRTHHDLMPQIANANALRWHGDIVAAVQSGDGQSAFRAALAIVEESDSAVQGAGPAS